MSQVIKEVRRALESKARSKRQGKTDLEMVDMIKGKKYRVRSEADLHERLPEGEPARLTSPSGYQKFVYSPERVKALGSVREFFFPGFGARLFEKKSLTHMELNVALGLPTGKLKLWIMRKEFPPPLGLSYTSFKGDPIPSYTIAESLTYAKILADELGQVENIDYWEIYRHGITPILFAAQEQMRKMVFEKGDKTLETSATMIEKR